MPLARGTPPKSLSFYTSLCILRRKKNEPQEALYLAERGQLLLEVGAARCLAELPTSPTTGLVAPLSSRRLATTLELFSALTEDAGVPLECYLAYRYLRGEQLVPRRRPAFLPQDVSLRKRIPADSPLPSLPLFGSAGVQNDAGIVFNAYPWTSNFSRNRCGSPAFCLAVVRALDLLPGVSTMRYLADNSREAPVKVGVVDGEGAIRLLSLGIERSARPVTKPGSASTSSA